MHSLIQAVRQRARAPWLSAVALHTLAPGDLAQAARRAIAAVDPDQAFHAVEPVRTTVNGIPGNFVLAGGRLTGVALIGLTPALLGIPGVVAGLVAQRRSEIGIRIALRARATDVLRVVLGRVLALAMAGMGVGLGLAGAITVCRLLGAAPPGSPLEPGLVLGGATLGLLGAVLVACAPPARQALKVDPAAVLRHE